jgi:(2Fe-2S) ferredoxin
MFYEKHVFVCENKRDLTAPRPSCGYKDSAKLRALLKDLAKEHCPGKRIRVNMSGCLDRCELGPVVVSYPEGKWFRLTSEEDVRLFVREYLVEGRTPGSLELSAEPEAK